MLENTIKSIYKHDTCNEKLGFEEVARNRLNYIHGHSKECKGCLYDCDKCFCCEDLWKLDRNTLKL